MGSPSQSSPLGAALLSACWSGFIFSGIWANISTLILDQWSTRIQLQELFRCRNTRNCYHCSVEIVMSVKYHLCLLHFSSLNSMNYILFDICYIWYLSDIYLINYMRVIYHYWFLTWYIFVNFYVFFKIYPLHAGLFLSLILPNLKVCFLILTIHIYCNHLHAWIFPCHPNLCFYLGNFLGLFLLSFLHMWTDQVSLIPFFPFNILEVINPIFIHFVITLKFLAQSFKLSCFYLCQAISNHIFPQKP